MAQPDRPQMTIRCMRIACWMRAVTNHTLRKCNTYCFSTETMVTRTRIVTLYVVSFFSNGNRDYISDIPP